MLIFDIETVPNKEMEKFLPEIKAPGNYKKPESIQKWLDENSETARYEQVSKMALDMCLAKVRAIGLWTPSFSPDGVSVLYVTDDESELAHPVASERQALSVFWNAVGTFGFPLIGFNSNAFDLPILFWRSMVLGVPGLNREFNRYDKDFVDLYEMLTFRNPRLGSMAGLGLKRVAEMLGIPNDTPDMDGSQVAEMSDEELVTYLTSDIELTRALYYRMEGIYFPNQPECEVF
jgi:hypothetical protein